MTRLLTIALAGVSLLLSSTYALNAQCRFPKTNAKTTLTYRFQPEITPDGFVLHILLEFQAGPTGTETLKVPIEWAGETLHAVSNVRIISSGASLDESPDAGRKILHSAPNRQVIVAYDLKKDWSGALVHPKQFHPVLLPEYFEFTGSNALIAPRRNDTTRETVNFDFRKLPADWALATSFGTTASASGRCQTYTGPWRDVDDGLYAAGDFRIHRFQIGRRPTVLAVRGNWVFTDDEAVEKIRKVIGLVRNFWHDDHFPYFLVTLKPYDRDHGSSDGSAFTNAFWMYVSRLDSLSGLLPQLAHESFHAWDPRRMGQLSNSEIESIKWFREGPTEYYAQLFTFQAGEQTASAYVDSLNKDLRKFPVSNSEYVRGRIIALWLDAAIRRDTEGSHSLDNFIFDMVRDAKQPLTLARIFKTADFYLSSESRVLLQNAVNNHADLPAPDQIPAVEICAHPELQDVPTFDAGLDVTHSYASGVISGVVENGPAFAAGLRDGQRLANISVDNGNPERLAKFKIHSGAEDREISFYPRGKTVQAWQYRLYPNSACDSASKLP